MGEQDKGEAMTRPAPVISAELRATASGLVPYAESRLMQEAADRLDALTDALAQARRGLFRCVFCGEFSRLGNDSDRRAACKGGSHGDR